MVGVLRREEPYSGRAVLRTNHTPASAAARMNPAHGSSMMCLGLCRPRMWSRSENTRSTAAAVSTEVADSDNDDDDDDDTIDNGEEEEEED